MTTIHANGGTVHVETNGDDRRPALVLLNPIGMALEIWDPLLEILTEHNFIVRLDIRGHGGTPLERADGSTEYSIADLAGDVLAVLDALEIDRPSIFGVSMGGLVALEFAATYPDRVDRLIVASTSLRLGSDEWWARTADIAAAEGIEAVVERAEPLWFSEQCRTDAPSICDASRAHLRATPVDAFVQGARAILGVDFNGRLSAIRASTLLIYGENDAVLRFNRVEDLLDRIEDSEAVMVGNTKHLAFLEHPESIARVVAEFLTDPDAR